jgi:hypothetical protein
MVPGFKPTTSGCESFTLTPSMTTDTYLLVTTTGIKVQVKIKFFCPDVENRNYFIRGQRQRRSRGNSSS